MSFNSLITIISIIRIGGINVFLYYHGGNRGMSPNRIPGIGDEDGFRDEDILLGCEQGTPVLNIQAVHHAEWRLR